MAQQAPRRITLRPLPKIVFLYPTFILAIVCAVWAQIGGARFVEETPTVAEAKVEAGQGGGGRG